MSVDALPSPTYEGGSVYLNGFSDGPKPYAEVLTFLRKVNNELVCKRSASCKRSSCGGLHHRAAIICKYRAQSCSSMDA